EVQCLWVLLVLLRLVTSVAPGKYRFAPGLYLQVGVPEAKSWIYRFTLRDKERFMGLGSARDVTLTQARKRMEEIRLNLVSKKIDPMAEREKALELGRVAKAKAVPFRERADQYITAHEGEWRKPSVDGTAVCDRRSPWQSLSAWASSRRMNIACR